MLLVLNAVLPVFALIFAGWASRKANLLGPSAASELNRFVVCLALPALLFDIVADAHWTEIWQPFFIATFGVSTGLIFCIALLVRFRRGRDLGDAAIDGLNAGYANTGFIGFPLTFAAIGSSALAPTLVATILTVTVLFGVALILIELSRQPESRLDKVLCEALGSVGRSPLFVAPALGAIFLLTATPLPASADGFLKLLGGAAAPCALVTLGLFLAGETERRPSNMRTMTFLVAMKLIAHPALTWGLATWVFGLPTAKAQLATLLATLPTGTGPFMLAEFYRKEAGLTSRVALVSTVGSLLTISLYCMFLLGR